MWKFYPSMYMNMTSPGTCCFSLFTKEDGQGDNQIVGPEGQFRLELNDLKSIFRLECEG